MNQNCKVFDAAIDDNALSQVCRDEFIGVEADAQLHEESASFTSLCVEGRTKEVSREQKARNGYRRSVYYLRKMKQRDASTLTARDRSLIKKHEKAVAKFEKNNSMHTISKEPRVESNGLLTLFKLPGPNARTSQQWENSFGMTIKSPPSDEIISNEPQEEKCGIIADRKSPCPSAPRNLQWRNPYGMSANSPGSDELSHQNPKNSKISPCINKPTVKRSRSDETLRHATKKSKPSATFGTPIDLQVAIVDKAQQDGKISPANWLLVEAKLMTLMLKADSEELRFDGAGWRRGIKVVGCENRKSLDFLTRAICSFDPPWPGAQLAVVPRFCPTVVLWIPPPVPESDIILELIDRQNPSLGAAGWHLVSATPCKNGTGSDVLIAVDEPSLEKIKSCGSCIKFGLGTLKIRIRGNRSQYTRDESSGDPN